MSEKWIEHICRSENHFCAQCERKIFYGNREWEHKYWKNGYPNSEYYHPRCCGDENTSDES